MNYMCDRGKEAMSTSASEEPIYSTLGDDPDLQDIVEMFVEEMPGRTQTFLNHLASGDWEGLCRVAHQLKGAAPIGRSPGRYVSARTGSAGG